MSSSPIQIFRRSVYGRERTYFVDDKMAASFRELTGRKTADSRDMLVLQGFGLVFEEVIAPVKV